MFWADILTFHRLIFSFHLHVPNIIERHQKADTAPYAAPPPRPPVALAVTWLAGRFMVMLQPPSVTGNMEEYDEYDGGSDAERTGDYGIDASVYARSGASMLKPRPRVAYTREDVPRPDLMATVIGAVRVSNLLVQGVDVNVGGYLHPPMYHHLRDDCRRYAVVCLCV